MSTLKVDIEWNLGDFATKRKDGTTLVTKTSYFVKDHVQNVRLVFDETGTITNATDYFTFGKPRKEQVVEPTLFIYSMIKVTYYNFFYRKHMDYLKP